MGGGFGEGGCWRDKRGLCSIARHICYVPSFPRINPVAQPMPPPAPRGLQVLNQCRQLLRYQEGLSLQQALVEQRRAGAVPDSLLLLQVGWWGGAW